MERRRVRTLARWCAAVAGVAALAAAFVAVADPPSRVARLAYVEGTVSFAPAGDEQWRRAAINRPLTVGDRLWFDQGARGEVQLSNAALRFGPLTSVALLNVDDRIEQLQVTQGVVQMNVWRMAAGESLEIDTPNLAFSITRAGAYRFEVDAQNDSTLVVVRDGEGDVYGEGAAYRIADGEAFRFYGTDLRAREYLTPPAPDRFERWALARQHRYERMVAARYVAPDVVGYEDLDQFGSWQVVADYGNVWSPRGVPADWAPYRYGHWAWVDPWGWTWIDDAPWGFAPFHYGRWAFLRSRWCWVPGPREVRPVYAPALVAFVGGRDFSATVASGAIGWVPLAPGEVYLPSYTVSREYFTRVNVTNTVLNNNYVANFYNRRDTARLRYAHLQRPAAVTVVPRTAFVQAQPVRRAAMAVNPQELSKAEVLPLAKIAPERPSFTGAAPPAKARPPVRALEKPVVAKAAPPPAAGPSARQGGQPTRPNVRVVEAVPPQPAAAAPGRRERAERPQIATERSNANGRPPATPPSAAPGIEQATEPHRPAGPTSATAGGPRALPPGQERRIAPSQPAPPTTAQAEPRRGPPVQHVAPPQGPPPAAEAEPHRGPPVQHTPPPQMAAPAAPPPAAQAEPHRGPPVQHAPPPQIAAPAAPPPGRPEVHAPAPPPPGAQAAPQQHEGNKGHGRGNEKKEG